MSGWVFNQSQYTERDFQLIPVGDYRVRITDVVEKRFRSGNEGYELTLAVNGYNSKLWFYLVLDPSNVEMTNQRIGEFFDCFGITNYAMGNGRQWIGAAGAVRVKHEEYQGNTTAKVAYCIKRKNQEKLEAWKNAGGQPAPAQEFAPIQIDDSELPFDL